VTGGTDRLDKHAKTLGRRVHPVRLDIDYPGWIMEVSHTNHGQTMTAKINPFRPNSPVNPGMFVGRLDEVEALERSLAQTRAGQPKHFMVTGERGIGKTSLLNYLRWVAQGYIDVDGDKFNFLVVDVDIEKATTPSSLARKIERALRSELGKTESARTFLSKTWEFISRVEAGGVSLKEISKESDAEDLLDELAYSLAATASRLCDAESEGSVFSARYQGLLLCVDEADSASKDLQLGALLKSLSERLQKRGCDKLMIGLAGLENLRDVLRDSHPSVLRIFDEIHLRRLSGDEVDRVTSKCIKEANENNAKETSIDDEATKLLAGLSEGYPHFIQQFGFSAFAADSDDKIDRADVERGAFGRRGALDLIGDRYYRDNFYNKIQQESYRRVLRVMADNLDAWMSKADIRARFKGDETTLSSALQALRERHIIVSKEGERGVYRLQQKGFALWIKLYTQDAELKAQLDLAVASSSAGAGG
jgi:AAA ATPase domain